MEIKEIKRDFGLEFKGTLAQEGEHLRQHHLFNMLM